MATTQLNDNAGPDHRFILLGASNLTLGLPRIVKAIRESCSGTIEIFAAHGHGRSYLQWSYVIVRGLPAIQDCGLWSDLASRPSAKNTYALVTDLGCDLFYGYRPEELVEGVTRCLHKLSEIKAQTIYVRPPLDRLNQLNDWTYFAAKNLFFPGPTVPWKRMRCYIHEVDREVSRLSDQLTITSFTPKISWYGIDPIHILSTRRSEAWSEILSSWNGTETWRVNGATTGEHFDIWKRRPAERRMWLRQQRQVQPAYQWENGVSLWVY